MSVTRPATWARWSRPTAPWSTAPAMPTRLGSATSGMRRPTPTAWPRHRSTTPMSALPTALPSAWPPPPGWTPYWGGATTTPTTGAATAAAPSASANVYGHWGNTVYSGTRSWYAGGGVAGTSAWAATAMRAPVPPATTRPDGSTTPGPATPLAPMTAPAMAPTAARATWRVPATTTSTPASAPPASSVSSTGPGGSSFDRSGATTAGPAGLRPCRRRLDLQRRDRQDQHLEHAPAWATTTSPTSTATSTATAATAGSAMRRRLERRGRRHLLGGPRIAGALHRC